MDDLSPPWVVFADRGKPRAILPAGRPGTVADVSHMTTDEVREIAKAANKLHTLIVHHKLSYIGRMVEDLRQQLENPAAWPDDAPIPEDPEIARAHPTESGDHDTYAEAARLVGAKRGKFTLTSLVNMLLHRVKKAEAAQLKAQAIVDKNSDGYQRLEAVRDAAREMLKCESDGHECPRDGSECDGCILQDALRAAP